MEFRILGKTISIGSDNTINKTEERSFTDVYENPLVGALQKTSFSNYNQKYAMKLSALNRAVKLVSGSLASMPINVYKYANGSDFKQKDYEHNLYDILNISPNNYQNKYNFIYEIVLNKYLKGQAIVKINRDKNQEIVTLQNLEPNNYLAIINEGRKVFVNKLNSKDVIDDSDVLHIYDYSIDGLNGISIIEQASIALDTAYNADNHALNWFKNGGNASGILSPKAGVTLNNTKGKEAKDKFVAALNNDLGGASNSIVVLDNGFDYAAITSNPAETQLLESRIHQIIEIARFTGIPPSLLFDQNSKYSTTEQQQLDYLNNCITPLCELIESEMLKKLFTKPEWKYREIRFDTENLMRADLATRGAYYMQLVQMGTTINEIRQKVGSEFPVVGGNKSFISTNLQQLDNLIVDQKNNLDNKLK